MADVSKIKLGSTTYNIKDTSKLPLTGGTMTGSITCTTSGANLKYGNITIYGGGSNGGINSMLVGDDVTIGDCNVGGCFGMKSTTTNAGFRFYNSSGTSIGGLQSTNGTLQWLNASGTAYNVYHTGNKPTYSDVGAAAASHTHNYAGSSSAGGQANDSAKLQGYTSDTAKTGNTIVRRDANGYIYASYYNSSSGAETPTTDSYIIYSNSDGWYRKSTLANIKSILGLGSAAYTASTAYATASHTHDDRYYTESEINNKIANMNKESYLEWGGRNTAGSVTPVGMSLSNEHNCNRLAFINGDALTFEYSSNGGSSWTNYNYTAAQKSQFCTQSFDVPIGRTSGNYSTSSRTRITLTAQTGSKGYVYTNPRKMLINVSTSGGMQVLVEYRTGANYQNNGAWSTFGTYSLSGWSGWNDIPLILGTLGGGTNQTGNNWQLRLTFIMTSTNSNYLTTASVLALRIYGENGWGVTSTMGATGHLYSFDMSQNATFPAKVTATSFAGPLTGNVTGNVSGSSGSCTGNSATATKATQDESGNNIKANYAASFSISDHTITLKNKNGGSLGTVTVPDNNTWRGIQNNLTSDSTTDSLSAAQGKALKALVDGKAASGHTHNYAGSASAGGTANSALTINATLPTLATAIESNEITVKDLGNNVPANSQAHRHGIDFRWYNTHWMIGNLRGSGTDSHGFGISYSADGSTYTNTFKVSPTGNITATSFNGYTIAKSVPSDAKFTDTVYTHPTTSGNKHIPSGGSSGQILRWSADGTAAWGADNNTNTIPTIYCDTAAGTAAKVGQLTGGVLKNGYYICYMVNANSSAGAITLNVNSKGAKSIMINGTASSSSNYSLPAGMYIIYYNGSSFRFRNDTAIPMLKSSGSISASNTSLSVNGSTLVLPASVTTGLGENG